MQECSFNAGSLLVHKYKMLNCSCAISRRIDYNMHWQLCEWRKRDSVVRIQWCRAVRSRAFQAGAVRSRAYQPGAVRSRAFQAGAVRSRVFQPGVVRSRAFQAGAGATTFGYHNSQDIWKLLFWFIFLNNIYDLKLNWKKITTLVCGLYVDSLPLSIC